MCLKLNLKISGPEKSWEDLDHRKPWKSAGKCDEVVLGFHRANVWLEAASLAFFVSTHD